MSDVHTVATVVILLSVICCLATSGKFIYVPIAYRVILTYLDLGLSVASGQSTMIHLQLSHTNRIVRPG